MTWKDLDTRTVTTVERLVIGDAIRGALLGKAPLTERLRWLVKSQPSRPQPSGSDVPVSSGLRASATKRSDTSPAIELIRSPQSCALDTPET